MTAPQPDPVEAERRDAAPQPDPVEAERRDAARRSILAKAAELTGWTDAELALIVGRPAPTVRAYRLGLRTEYLDGKSRTALLRCVRLWIDRAEAGYEELRRIV